jgi:TatD DNase family protein
MIDTHSHLFVEEFDEDRAEALQRAREAGVERILCPAIDSESHEAMLAMCRENPNFCLPMIGLHPTSVNDNPDWEREIEIVEQYLATPPTQFCAIGEVGLDLHWSSDFLAEQQQALRRQIELSLQYNLPLVMHTRDAWPEMLALLDEYRGRGLRGVMHAFSGTLEQYWAVREFGDFVFGISGVVTYKRSPLADIARDMRLSEIVLETDAPYLTPVPFRGRRNESAYLPLICEKIAEIKGFLPEEIAASTTANARRMFSLD